MEKGISWLAFGIVAIFAIIGVACVLGGRANVGHGYVGVEFHGSADNGDYTSAPPYRDNVPSWLHVRRE